MSSRVTTTRQRTLPLPSHLLSLVYAYDPTYHHVFNICLLELQLLWEHHDTLNNLMERFRRDILLFEVYSEGAINVLLSSNV